MRGKEDQHTRPSDDRPIRWEDDSGQPRSGWDDLRLIVDALELLFNLVRGLARRVANSFGALPRTVRVLWGALVALSAAAGGGELLTGWQAQGQLTLRVGITFALATPATAKTVRVLNRESARNRRRIARATVEAPDDFVARRRGEEAEHARLGRQLRSDTDLARLPTTEKTIRKALFQLRRRDYAATIILVRELRSDLKVVLSFGEFDPALDEGQKWPRHAIYGHEDGYRPMMKGLHLHHVRVRLETGARSWDLILAAGGVISDEATLLLCEAATALLEDACATQQRPKQATEKE
jgi:hypothetical protein